MCNFFRKKGMVKLFGWKYSYSKDGEFAVIPDRPIEKPKTFFKYYSLSDNSIDALTGLYIYASHPNLLNDPHDCYEKIVDIDSEDSLKALWNGFYDGIIQTYNGDMQKVAEYSRYVFKTIYYRKIGIFSMTDSSLNEALWAYYTGNEGFCLEFDIDKFPFRTSGPFPINYQKELGPVSTRTYGLGVAALVQTNVKKDCWSNEKEWRLIVHAPEGLDLQSFGQHSDRYNSIDDHDHKFRYPLDALKSITITQQFFNNKVMCVKTLGAWGLEVRCMNGNSNHVKLLDFLSNVQIKARVKTYCLIEGDRGIYNRHEISVIKTKNLLYRILGLND